MTRPSRRARPGALTRVVDGKGRVSVLSFRYHVGMAYCGLSVAVTSEDGLIHVHHAGVLVATHARRHLPEHDDRFTDRPPVARPTKGDEVLRRVDTSGAVSFAGTSYRAGNSHKGRTVGVRMVGDTIQITLDGLLIRTHKARHDRSKEYGALSKPKGKPRRTNVA